MGASLRGLACKNNFFDGGFFEGGLFGGGTYSMIYGIVYYSTKKKQHSSDILKSFFIRHSSEYETSDNDLIVNRNIYPDAATCHRMRLIGPKSGQLGPIDHCLLEESN